MLKTKTNKYFPWSIVAFCWRLVTLVCPEFYTNCCVHSHILGQDVLNVSPTTILYLGGNGDLTFAGVIIICRALKKNSSETRGFPGFKQVC